MGAAERLRAGELEVEGGHREGLLVVVDEGPESNHAGGQNAQNPTQVFSSQGHPPLTQVQMGVACPANYTWRQSEPRAWPPASMVGRHQGDLLRLQPLI